MSEGTSSTIRTPDQRLRVFVSSTLAEMADERAAVRRAVTAVGLTPVMFELGARPHPPGELYRAYLAQSDLFVGLYWQSYGWIGPGMDISGLEDELQRSGGLPRLLYLKKPAPEREDRLTEMIRGVEAEAEDSYRPFTTPDELEQLVRDDLAILLSERFVASGSGGASRAGSAADSEQALPRSLPLTSTSLIGRDEEVGQVVDLLSAPDVRLVTLSGPGGIGKTRLAIAVAEHLEQQRPGPTVFVPLASVEEPAQVMPAIAAAVGAVVEGAARPIDVVVEHLGDQPMLLVLDNLEQVVAVAPELDELLARCAGLVVLATSRTVLRLRAEREHPVRPLVVPPGDEPSLEQVAALPAVRLFVDRAQGVRSDFTLTEQDAAAVVAICRRLDGLPLAIEIAAARTRLLEPAALLARLEDRVDAIGAGPVDLPERQRTLRATVEWSIDLLTHDEAHLLATLGVFVDGWTLEAATAVSGLAEDQALDLLDALAGHSLVQVVPMPDGPRFRMLESVRELAAERLEADGDDEPVRMRHAAWFCTLVTSSDWPDHEQVAWADRLQADAGNVRTAVRWSLEHDVGPLPHLFRVLWLYWQMRDRMPEGRAWIEQLEGRAEELDEHARAELLFTSAVTAVEVGDDERALAAVDSLEVLRSSAADPYLATAAPLALSWILPLLDDFDGALETALEALAGFEQHPHPTVAFAALTAGMVHLAMGQVDHAEPHLLRAEALGTQQGNSWMESASRTQLAGVAVAKGDLEQARTRLHAAVEAEGTTEHSTITITFALVAEAHLALARGDAARAAAALGAADGLRTRSGLRAWPSKRRGEAALLADAREQLLEGFAARFAAGQALTRRAAVALVRGEA
jgi:predicted ATPase